ncbi:MAG: hypothetical protein ABIC57_02820, partial [bacterium]
MDPEKSKNSKLSFEDKISDAQKSTPVTSFHAYPKDVEFTGQDSGEKIILVVRQHWAVFIPFFMKIMLSLVLPSIILRMLEFIDNPIKSEDSMFVSGVVFLWIMILITYTVITFLKWFYTVSIITSERIVDIDFNNIFYHKFSECELRKIEDVSHVPAGIWATVFDFGTVHIQTAAEQREFEFK